MSTRLLASTLLLSAVLANAAVAQSTTDATAPVMLDRVLVSGEQPGPGMWKVMHGSNVLWIVGTHSPLPEKMTWRAKGIEAVVAQSQEILGEPRASVTISKLGFFTSLMLLPSAMEVKNNPDGATLKDILPPEIYARWLVAREKYIDGYNTEGNDIERWRPMFAAAELYSSALRQAGLVSSSPVGKLIREAAKKHKVKFSDVNYEPVLRDPRAAVRDLNNTRLADVDCLVKTMERIDTDIRAMRARANAWAVGDVETLRKMPPNDQRAACEAIIRNAPVMKALGQQDLLSQVEATWLQAAEKSLATNAVTLASLPVARLVATDGYMAKLKARGFTVREPDADE